MKIKFTRNLYQIEDARIIYRNFSGIGGKFNREGDRNFKLVIPNEELKDQLLDAGFNVKIKPPREEGDTPFMTLEVKVKFSQRGPSVYVNSGDSVKRLNEETINMLDEISIANVEMDIRAYDWEVNGRTGRTAYLDALNVTQNIDRFGARYASEGKLTDNNLPF